MEKKAKIFISSTIYGFRYLRQALKYNFEKVNIDVQCSERPDFDGIISDENPYMIMLIIIYDLTRRRFCSKLSL